MSTFSFRNLNQGDADEWFKNKHFVKDPVTGAWSKPKRVIHDHPQGLRSVQSKPVEGRALDRRVPRKAKRSVITPRRTHVLFRVFSVRPNDSDNYSTKQIQDMLVHAGLLDGDEWHRLYHTVISEKVYEKMEERTEVVITPLMNEKQNSVQPALIV